MSGHELNTDEALKALLRAESPAPPFDDVDWARLHARITAGAAPLLRGRTGSWWQYLAAWSYRAAPAAAAAAAAVMLLLGQIGRPTAEVTTAAAEFRIVEEELADVMIAESLPLLVPTGDDLLDAALFNEAGQ